MPPPVTMPEFQRPLPRTEAALRFADERHAGQRREVDDSPFVTHPVEVATMLEGCGYRDEVVAAGVLHDVLEDTDAKSPEIEKLFGGEVAALVRAVTDDPSIQDPAERKAALRLQVANAGPEAAAIFAADKVSKAHELRVIASRGALPYCAALRIDHYQESFDMLVELIPGHGLLDRLRMELDSISAQTARGA